MTTIPQLPQTAVVNSTDRILIDQGGISASTSVALLHQGLQPALVLGQGALLGRVSTVPGQPESVGVGAGLQMAAGAIMVDTTQIAPLSSPTFSGHPTAPTPPQSDSSNAVATTAFVQQKYFKTVTLTGDLTGTGSTTISTSLPNIATPGIYSKVSVNSKGQVTSGTVVLSPADVVGLAAVATTGNYADLSNKPSPYTLPMATAISLGGVKPGSNLSIAADGTLNAAAAPVSTVAGRTGAIALSSSDISGLAAVATSGSFGDLANRPLPYSLPVANSTFLGGIKAGANVSVASDGTLSVASPPVTAVAGRTGSVALSATDVAGLAAVATTGSYADLSNRPTTYSLPPASPASLGGVKSGTNLSVLVDGTLSVSPVGMDVSATTTVATGSSAARLLANRHAETLNVLDYGADPTGAADFSAIFQTLAAGMAGSGATIRFPRGVYRFDNAVYVQDKALLEIDAGVTFVGIGRFNTDVDNSVLEGQQAAKTFMRVGSVDGNSWTIYASQVAATTNGTTSYEKAAIYATAGSYDRSTYTLGTSYDTATTFKDIVGLQATGTMMPGNTRGRAWGIAAQATVRSGSDGTATGIEVDLVNNGASQPENSRWNTKNGLSVVNLGPSAGTNGIIVSNGGGSWFDGVTVLKDSVSRNAFVLRDLSTYPSTTPALIDSNGNAQFRSLALSGGTLSSFNSTWTSGNPGNGAFQWNFTGSVPSAGVIGPLTNVYNNGPYCAQAEKFSYFSAAGNADSVDNAQTLIGIYNPTNVSGANMGAELVRWTVGITPQDTTHNWTHVVEEYNVVNRGLDMGWKAYRNDPVNNIVGPQQITGIVNYSPEATGLGQPGEGKNLLFAELFGQSAANNSSGLPSRFYNASLYEPNCIVGAVGRAIYINGDVTGVAAQIPYAPLEVNLTWLHGLRTTTATFQDGAALTMAAGQAVAWSTGTSTASIKSVGTGVNQDIVLAPAGTGTTTVTSLKAMGVASFNGGIADASYSLQTPSTGFTITVALGVSTLQLMPSGTLANGSITMPTGPVNGQWLLVCSTASVTSCSFIASPGQTIAGAPSTLPAYVEVAFQFQSAAARWVCQSGNDSRLANLAPVANSGSYLDLLNRPALNPAYGTGVDGSVSLSSGTTTLSRDMHYANLTIAGTAKLVTAGFRVFISGTLDISSAPAGAIQYNGSNGNNAAGATAGPLVGNTQPPTGAATSLLGGWVGFAGGGGSTGVGSPGTASSNWNTTAFLIGGVAGAAGAGGAGVSVGGAGGAVTAVPYLSTAQFNTPTTVFQVVQGGNGTLVPLSTAICGGPGGGGGGGDGTNAGGGGGGGSAPGGFVAVYARSIQRGINTSIGIFQARGGAAGSGGNAAGGNAAGGGGGGASGGGFVYIVTDSLLGSIIPNSIDVSGGAGGAGGGGSGTGKGGSGGAGGNGGNCQVLNLGAPSFTVGSFNAGGSAGGIAVNPAGATGGAGASVRGSL